MLLIHTYFLLNMSLFFPMKELCKGCQEKAGSERINLSVACRNKPLSMPLSRESGVTAGLRTTNSRNGPAYNWRRAGLSESDDGCESKMNL